MVVQGAVRYIAAAVATALVLACIGPGIEIAVGLVVDLAVCFRSVLTVAAVPAFLLVSPSAVLKDECFRRPPQTRLCMLNERIFLPC